MDSSNRPKKSFFPDGISNDGAADQDADRVANGAPARRTAKIATVSHTLDAAIADRLRHFAFRQRISESAVIEFALRELFEGADDAALGTRLRNAGAALRRKT